MAEFIWRDDHNGENHWEFFRTNDLSTNAGDPNLTASYFRPLASGYLKNSNLFICPDETIRRTVFQAMLMNSNLSYGVRLTALAMNPTSSALIVERHLQQSGQALKPGLNSVGSSLLDWTRELHAYKPNENRGVLGFLDGHVEYVTARKLPGAFDYHHLATNLLAIP